MEFALKNEKLSLTVSSLGAEMRSLQTADGTEYLWQGDPMYWKDRAPNLFPFVGRLTDNTYKYLGKTYPMTIHGFAAAEEFAVVEHSRTRLVLELCSNAVLKESYPFDFSLRVGYELKDTQVDITFRVENLGENTMPFGIGGHPGFNVPLTKGEAFEDYELEFSVSCCPDRVGFSPAVYMNGHDAIYPIREERFIDLRHDLFDEDAIILKNMAREVTLRSRISGRGITLTYPDLPYLGIWHWPKTDAPYVCIEPWSSLPARQGVVEELSCKSDMLQLPKSRIYETLWSIAVR